MKMLKSIFGKSENVSLNAFAGFALSNEKMNKVRGGGEPYLVYDPNTGQWDWVFPDEEEN
jgi:hypothetical protein